MIAIYFSGTGNTKYIAKRFANNMGCQSYSIEEKVDFKELILSSETIAFCYPIYGSCVPNIMESFVQEIKDSLNGKNLVILVTQMLFSGDGARAFTDLLEGINYKVIYAEHFDMPLNIPNIPVINVKNGDKLNKKIKKADKKIARVCMDIKNNTIKKRGFNKVSKFMGYNFQRKGFEKLEYKVKNGVKVTEDCILCQACVKVCPKENLFVGDEKIQQRGKCTVCNRCVNICPKKAITVLYHGKMKEQYRGIK